MYEASSGFQTPHRLVYDFAVCSMRPCLYEASSGFRWPHRVLDYFAVCSMVPLVYDSVFSCMASFLLDEDAASQERVSSTVAAPCNEVSLCDRAG